jgi:hypothetical protein
VCAWVCEWSEDCVIQLIASLQLYPGRAQSSFIEFTKTWYDTDGDVFWFHISMHPYITIYPAARIAQL